VIFKNKLEWNTSFYYFSLKNAIVRRTDSVGADYYVNAGGTIQKGIEVWLNGRIISNQRKFINTLSIFSSFTYQPYRFDEYVVGSAVYSGNELTGVPRKISVSGINIKTKYSWYANITFNLTSSIPLNDANTVYAKSYHLLQMKLGKELILNKCFINFFVGA